MLILAAANPGTLRADSVDDVVAAQMSKRHIPGVSIAVIQGGAIVKAKGYGVMDVTSRYVVTPDTLFQAGSVSKPVTAMGALALVDAGKLSLDSDINSVLKSWHVPENEFTKEKKVLSTYCCTVSRFLSCRAYDEDLRAGSLHEAGLL